MNQVIKNRHGTSNSNADHDECLRISLINQDISTRKKRVCPLQGVDKESISFTNMKMILKFVTSGRGKILPSRVTGLSMKKQRYISRAIKIARELAIISPIRKPEE